MNDVARHTKGGFRPSSAINESGPSAKALAALVRIYMEGAPSRRLERRATTKNKKTRACVIDFLSCISYTGTSYPDWVSS